MSESAAVRATKLSPLVFYVSIAILAVLAGIIGRSLPPYQFIIAIAASILSIAALARIEVALAILVIAVPLTGFKASVGPVPIDAVTMSTALLIASYGINRARGSRSEDNKKVANPNPYLAAFLLFILFASISAIVAPSSVKALSVLVRFAGYFLLVSIVGRSVATKKTLSVLLALMVVAGVLTGVYGIYQFTYAPQMNQLIVHDPTEGDLAGDITTRLSATFGNPNFYSEYLVMLLPISIALFMGIRGAIRRAAIGVSTLFIFACLILTYTRGSWMAAGIGIILMSLLANVWLLFSWMALFAVVQLSAPSVAQRLASITDIATGTAGFRVKLWRIAAGIIREHPLLGVGIGSFYNAFTEYTLRHPDSGVGWVVYGAHNSYLTLWAETGIFGVIAFVSIIFIAVKYGLYLAREKRQDRYLSWVNAAILAGIIGFSLNSLTSNSFEHPQGAIFFWFLLGLQLAIGRLRPEPLGVAAIEVTRGSVVLGSLRGISMSFKTAAINHPAYRLALRIRNAWQTSKLFLRMYEKPYAPAFLKESVTYTKLNQYQQAINLWVNGSKILPYTGMVSSNPLKTGVAFASTALIARLVTGLLLSH